MGSGTYMLGPKHYLKNGRDTNKSGGGTAPSSEGGGGTGTSSLTRSYLTGTGRAIDAPGGNIIPEGKNLSVQSNLNKWIENSLRALDTKLPVAVVDSLPGTGQYEGDLVLLLRGRALCLGRQLSGSRSVLTVERISALSHRCQLRKVSCGLTTTKTS